MEKVCGLDVHKDSIFIMSEIINNSEKRKELLKHLILQLHDGEATEQVKDHLIHLLRSVPYTA